jgi:carboxyl-terminal processing protease
MLLLLPPAWVQQAPENKAQLEDFDQALNWLRSHYAWGERVEWEFLRDEFRPKAGAAPTPHAFHRVMEDLLDQLADAHTHLGSNLADSWRLPPGDFVAEWRGDDAVVIAVKPGSAAAAARIRPGMKVVAVGGKPLNQALAPRRSFFLKGMDEDAQHWMLNALLAGKRGEPRTLQLKDGGKVVEVALPDGPMAALPVPETRLLPGEVGYIAFPDFADEAQVRRMDEALDRFPQAKAWILDLRYNTGGDTAIMRPVLGRFFSKKMRFAFMRKRSGEGLGAPWEEEIAPRGKVFEGPVAVLVSPWTESVAEGAALAIQGTLRGFAFGTRTAGLGAAVHSITLKHSGLKLQASTEPVYDLFMRPRSAFRPKVLLDLANEGGADPILDAALAWIGTVAGKR